MTQGSGSRSDGHMDAESLKLINEGTLQARHFAGIGLSRRQLHVWCDKTGFEPRSRDSGRWRRFSPAEVLRLATVRELKGRTGLAITDHRDLIEFVASDDGFLVPTLSLWREGGAPALLTDLESSFEVAPAAFRSIGDLLKRSPFWCALSLRPPIGLMLAAVARGGSTEQRLWAVRMPEPRVTGIKAEHASEDAYEPSTKEEMAEQHIRLTNS